MAQTGDNRVLWITWENQLRNRSMADKLNVELYEIRLPTGRLKRYLAGSIRTLGLLKRVHPKVVYAQNPSVVLTALIILSRSFFQYKFVSDSHFGGVTAYNGNWLFQKILDFCNRQADLVIVTNDEHARYINSIGGKSFVCEDPLPDLSQHYENEQADGKIVLFICSYDIDEPYIEVFMAARLLAQEGYTICVSGNYSKRGIRPEDYPDVTFLGFLSEQAFYQVLYQSHVVIDLTTHENCLVCGAYEAMAAEKPLVTSDTRALRKHFNKGTVFSENSTDSIASAVRAAYENRQALILEIKKWKELALLDTARKVEGILEVTRSWVQTTSIN